MQSRAPKRREVLALDGAKLNIKLMDKCVRVTVIQSTGHYAYADLDISGCDRTSSRLDLLADVLDAELEKRGDEYVPLNAEEEDASQEA